MREKTQTDDVLIKPHKIRSYPTFKINPKFIKTEKYSKAIR